jgi:hypothetical protein
MTYKSKNIYKYICIIFLTLVIIKLLYSCKTKEKLTSQKNLSMNKLRVNSIYYIQDNNNLENNGKYRASDFYKIMSGYNSNANKIISTIPTNTETNNLPIPIPTPPRPTSTPTPTPTFTSENDLYKYAIEAYSYILLYNSSTTYNGIKTFVTNNSTSFINAFNTKFRSLGYTVNPTLGFNNMIFNSITSVTRGTTKIYEWKNQPTDNFVLYDILNRPININVEIIKDDSNGKIFEHILKNSNNNIIAIFIVDTSTLQNYLTINSSGTIVITPLEYRSSYTPTTTPTITYTPTTYTPTSTSTIN